MAIVFLNLVEKTLRVAKQALGKHAGKPGWFGLPLPTRPISSLTVFKKATHSPTC